MTNFSDSHTDIMTAIKKKSQRETVVKRIKENGGDFVSLAIFTTEKKQKLREIERLNYEIKFYKEKYDLSLFMSIEDLGFIESKKDFVKLISLKPFSATLTWNFSNQFAGGSQANDGLTGEGRRVIDVLEANDIIIDSAHLSRKSFSELCRISSKPIYNSHSNINSIFSHKRNLTDKQIEKIVLSDGFVGITFYQKFISNEKITSFDIAKQFDYLIKHFGSDNFGIGSDLYGFDKKFLPIDFGDDFFEKLKNEMKNLGYNQNIIDKIMWKNYENFSKKMKKI